MDKTSTKIREWTQRLNRFQKSGVTLTQFCKDEHISIPTFYYWRNRIRSHSDSMPTSGSVANEASRTESASSIRITIHSGPIKIECLANSPSALETLLAWAARQQDTNFKPILIQG